MYGVAGICALYPSAVVPDGCLCTSGWCYLARGPSSVVEQFVVTVQLLVMILLTESALFRFHYQQQPKILTHLPYGIQYVGYGAMLSVYPAYSAEKVFGSF